MSTIRKKIKIVAADMRKSSSVYIPSVINARLILGLHFFDLFD